VAPDGFRIEGLQLEQENPRLFRHLERLAAGPREVRSPQPEIAHLKEQLASRTQALFGDSSERATVRRAREGRETPATPLRSRSARRPIAEWSANAS
jgi:hypothetical protein